LIGSIFVKIDFWFHFYVVRLAFYTV